jgi:hypothetical protein
MSKFHIKQSAGRWWLWDPNLGSWGFCLSFEDAIARMDRVIRHLRERNGVTSC